MAIMIPLFWVAMLVYGLILLRSSAKRNLGVTLVILFFSPMIMYLILMVFFQIFFGLSVVDLYRLGCGMDAVHYTECYPEGYFS